MSEQALRQHSVTNAGVSMNNDSTIHVGLDVHKESIVAAYSVGQGEVQCLGSIGVMQRDLDRGRRT